MPGLDDLDVDAAAQNLASVGGPPIPDVSPVNAPPAPIAGPPAPPADPTLPENQAPVAPPSSVPPNGGVEPPPGMPLSDNPVADYKAAEAAREKAQADADKAAAKAAEEEAKRKEHEAEVLRKQQEERDEHEAALNHTRERLVTASDQADRQVADFQFHDYMSTRTDAQKVMILMGGFLSGLAGNKSNEILDRAISQDFEKQKAELASKENLARLKREGVRDFDGYMRDQRLVLDHKEERARLALAAEMEAQAARSNNPVVIAKAQVAAADLREKASVKLGDVQKTYAETQYTNARARLAAAKAAAAHGGAGGNGKLQALTTALQKSGGEITPEVAAVADHLHMKRADLTSMAASFKQERRTDQADRKVTNQEVSTFSRENALPEITKRAQALTKVNNLLSQPNVDPLTQVLVLQEFDKASKGGTATASAMQTALSHLAGGTDKIGQFIEKVSTGGLSSEQLNTLRTSVRAALEQNRDEADNVHEAFNQTFRNMDSYPDQKAIDRLADSYFGGLGYSRKPKGGDTGQPSGKSEPVADGPTLANTTRVRNSDGTIGIYDTASGKLLRTLKGP